jgi:hypothetical protein
MGKEIQCDEVYYKENEGKGLDPCCLICTSHAKAKNGYVQFRKDGFLRMHRWVYWRKTGERPEVVVHLCGHKDCMNINHMRAATVEEAKGEGVGGNLNALGNRGGAVNRRFTDDQVREIRHKRSLGVRPSTLAREFDTHPTTITRIVNGETYGDVV